MAPSFTTTMSAGSAQLLQSSLSSSTSTPRHSSSQISKIYRQASTLFLTRRLPESLSTILPVITSSASEDLSGSNQTREPAPIEGASRTTRIKMWSLYLTILNAVVELDPDEGKQAFGSQEWRSLVSKVREGEVWEEVVKNGYGGIEGDVDPDVVINLATLLLAHARTQELNQTRLEAYLAASTRPNLDISNRLQATQDGLQSPHRPNYKSNGTDTPRDLNARVKILELYTLHVLLRNNEWEYAREFISISSVLDEERREAFLSALQSLKDDHAEAANRQKEEQSRQDEQLRRDLEEARKLREEDEDQNRENQRQKRERALSMSERASSEVDYGIDTSHINGSANGSTKERSVKGSSASKASRNSGSKVSHAPRPSMSAKKAVVAPSSLLKRAGTIISNLRALIENMTMSFKGNQMVLLRTLAFIVAFLLLISRRDVKEKIKRMWAKVLATAGMGVKVSYI